LDSNNRESDERTEIVHGTEKVLSITIDCLRQTQVRWDVCSDSRGVLLFNSVDMLKNAFANALSRGVRVRMITEITKDNLIPLKENLSLISELKHMEGVMGLYVVTDTHYISAVYSELAVSSGSLPNQPQPMSQSIFSNVRSFVKQQQGIFDNLWKGAMPAKQIIAEIEDELKPEFVSHYDKISEIIQLVSDIIASSRSEVNILISSEDLFLLDEARLLEGLQDAVTRNVTLRILIQAKDELLIRINKILKIDRSKHGSLLVRYNTKQLAASHTILMKDNRYSTMIETRKVDETQDRLEDRPAKYATYSNNRSRVWTNNSLFERQWAESEIANTVISG
jgi:two-component system sensor histidine kinase VicK